MDPEAVCHMCGWRCKECELKNTDEVCSPRKHDEHGNYCGTTYVKFLGQDCIKLFVQYLTRDRMKDFTAYAHGNCMYDSYFILKQLQQTMFHPAQMILSGSKVLHFTIPKLNINFYDSLKIFNIPLKDLPSALLSGEFQSTLEKQYFPMLMLDPKKLRIKTDFPSKDMFITDRMNSSELQKFNDWHAKMANTTFDMESVLISYCSTDALILFKALLSLQTLICEITSCDHLPGGVDALKNCPTISSLALKVFRQVHLKEYYLITLHSTVGNDVKIVKAIKQGTQMTLQMPDTGPVTEENLRDYKITDRYLLRSSLAMLPPKHYNCSKKNNSSIDELCFVLHYESLLVSTYGRDNVTSFHSLSRGQRPIKLEAMNTTCYPDGYFEIAVGDKVVTHAINYLGCWFVYI
mgnify:CR=1 FL=1